MQKDNFQKAPSLTVHTSARNWYIAKISVCARAIMDSDEVALAEGERELCTPPHARFYISRL